MMPIAPRLVVAAIGSGPTVTMATAEEADLFELGVDLCPCCGEQACRDLDCTTCEDCGAPWGQAHADGCPREEERNG